MPLQGTQQLQHGQQVAAHMQRQQQARGGPSPPALPTNATVLPSLGALMRHSGFGLVEGHHTLRQEHCTALAQQGQGWAQTAASSAQGASWMGQVRELPHSTQQLLARMLESAPGATSNASLPPDPGASAPMASVPDMFDAWLDSDGGLEALPALAPAALISEAAQAEEKAAGLAHQLGSGMARGQWAGWQPSPLEQLQHGQAQRPSALHLTTWQGVALSTMAPAMGQAVTHGPDNAQQPVASADDVLGTSALPLGTGQVSLRGDSGFTAERLSALMARSAADQAASGGYQPTVSRALAGSPGQGDGAAGRRLLAAAVLSKEAANGCCPSSVRSGGSWHTCEGATRHTLAAALGPGVQGTRSSMPDRLASMEAMGAMRHTGTGASSLQEDAFMQHAFEDEIAL